MTAVIRKAVTIGQQATAIIPPTPLYWATSDFKPANPYSTYSPIDRQEDFAILLAHALLDQCYQTVNKSLVRVL